MPGGPGLLLDDEIALDGEDAASLAEVEQWLESFEGSGVAGAPWETGDYVTLGSLSPETGDPIKQTITVNEGLLDDYDLDYEASEGNIPNRAFIYIRQGRLVCEEP